MNSKDCQSSSLQQAGSVAACACCSRHLQNYKDRRCEDRSSGWQQDEMQGREPVQGGQDQGALLGWSTACVPGCGSTAA